MKKKPKEKKVKKKKAVDDLRPEYNFSELKNGVHGKYVALETSIHGTKIPRRRTH
jgi:hypothetical protein